jgi:hypothetical protein
VARGTGFLQFGLTIRHFLVTNSVVFLKKFCGFFGEFCGILGGSCGPSAVQLYNSAPFMRNPTNIPQNALLVPTESYN